MEEVLTLWTVEAGVAGQRTIVVVEGMVRVEETYVFTVAILVGK